jgi:hypothetical protein
VEDWYVAERYDQKHAFLSFTVHGCKGAGQAIDIDGNVIDEFTVDGCD